MRLLRIVLRNFLSYDELELDLSYLTTLAIVGKVGSGKSSLFEAVTWGLWGKADRDEVIREDADAAMVQIDFLARGSTCSVIRTINRTGRGATLSLIIDGKNVPEHIKGETQAKINRQIGLTFDAITSGPLMTQEQKGNLMSLDPRDAKDLLIELFGADQYEPYHAESAALASQYKADAADAGEQISRLDGEIAMGPEAEAELTRARYDLAIAINERDEAQSNLALAKERQITLREQNRHANTLQQTVEMLTARIAGDEKEHGRVLRQISDAHQSIDAPEPTFDPVPEVDQEQVTVALAEVEVIRREVDEWRGLSGQLPLLRQQLERSQKLASIVQTVPCGGEGIYATCRFLTGAPKQDEIADQNAEVERVEARMATLRKSVDLDAALDRHSRLQSGLLAYERETIRREGLREQWRLKAENAKQLVKNGKEMLARIETQIARDKSQLERAAQQLREMPSKTDEVNALEIEIEGLKTQVEEQGRSIDMVYQPAVVRAEERVARIAEAKAARPPLVKAEKEARGKAEVYATLAKAFHRDGIPTLIVENGIPLIEERANDILTRMPDNYRVRILTQREKKRGAGMIDRVTVVVEKRGRMRSFKNLSGGEKFRVNFSLRVAIGHVLAHRTGATIDTLMIDEGFGTQDLEGIEAMLQSLAAVEGEFGLVLVISHTEALNERIESRLEISRPPDGVSNATLVA